MENIPIASVVGSLMYDQTCTRPDISFAVGMLGRYQSNPGLEHWKATKKVLRYLQGTKNYMFTDNAVVDAIKLILLFHTNFSIVKKVVNKIEMVK